MGTSFDPGMFQFLLSKITHKSVLICDMYIEAEKMKKSLQRNRIQRNSPSQNHPPVMDDKIEQIDTYPLTMIGLSNL